MTDKFGDLWRFINKNDGIITVQEYHELQYVFNLIHGCESYLEIGTAEGKSMYVLAHALAPNARITYVDIDEDHTRPHREQIITELTKMGLYITPVHGNSHDPAVVMKANGRYDVVFIDAGHEYEDVIQDAINYGKMATKFLIFHDINLTPVRLAFNEYVKECGLKSYTISNSETYGYGIVELK